MPLKKKKKNRCIFFITGLAKIQAIGIGKTYCTRARTFRVNEKIESHL